MLYVCDVGLVGLGRGPLKAEVTGSNPVRRTMDKLKELELDLKSCLQMVEGLQEGRVGPYELQLANCMGYANRTYGELLQELSLTRKE